MSGTTVQFVCDGDPRPSAAFAASREFLPEQAFALSLDRLTAVERAGAALANGPAGDVAILLRSTAIQAWMLAPTIAKVADRDGGESGHACSAVLLFEMLGINLVHALGLVRRDPATAIRSGVFSHVQALMDGIADELGVNIQDGSRS